MTTKIPSPHSDKAITDLQAAIQEDLQAAREAARQKFVAAIQAALDSDDPTQAAAVKASALRANAATTPEEVAAAVADLPQPGQPAEQTKTAPTPTHKDDGQAPAWFDTYVSKFGATDDDGKPTKAAAKSNVDSLAGRVDNLDEDVDTLHADVQAIGKHLGYNRDGDGNVTFTFAGRAINEGINPTMAGIVGGGVWVLAFLILWIGRDVTWTQASIWSLVIGIGAGLVAGLVTAGRDN